jgi:hypothetical protein
LALNLLKEDINHRSSLIPVFRGYNLRFRQLIESPRSGWGAIPRRRVPA